MQKLITKFKSLKLFSQMFMVMVISIVSVSIVVAWTTIHMSTELFMRTFSITNNKVIDQIKMSFESFGSSVATVVNQANQNGTIKTFLKEGDTDSISMAKSYYNAADQMKRLQSVLDSYEVGITISGVNGRTYSTDRLYMPLDDHELKTSVMRSAALDDPMRLIYQYYHGSPSSGYSQDEQMIFAFKALYERSTSSSYGVVYIGMKERDFRKFYNNYTSAGNDVFILNSDGVIVSSSVSSMIGERRRELLEHAVHIQEQALDYIHVNALGKDSIVLSEYLPAYNFYIVNTIDKEMALGQMLDIRTLVFLCTGIVLLALFITFLITRQITKSLTTLVGQMANVTKNDFANQITVTGSYEIKELGNAYNYMLDELQDYVDKLLETQKGQRNAELASLQRQINPHFLYNTLASIKVLVQQGSKEQATEAIHSLISLLQNTIGQVSETITVVQELEILKHYVQINHVRYGDRIRVNYFVSPDCAAYHIPKLIIQPFIENAFFHAFNQKEGGYIHVLVSCDEKQLICEVVDNGDGMDEKKSEEDLLNVKRSRQLFSGIGIRNVHERIRLLYGEDYGVSITSSLGEGTRVRITLPLITET